MTTKPQKVNSFYRELKTVLPASVPSGEVLRLAAFAVNNYGIKITQGTFNPEEPLLFVDFETNRAGDFYVLGIRYGEHFEQVVLTPELDGFAEHHGLTVQTPKEACEKLISICEDECRTMVAYGELERALVSSVLGIEINNCGFKYLNLHRVAKKWKSKFHKASFDALPPLRRNASKFLMRGQVNSLASLTRLCGLEAPKDYAPGKTTSRFNSLIESLKKKNQDYSRLGPSTKAKGTKALKHNKFDVLALEPLLIAITRDSPPLLNTGFSPRVIS